jgi:predicted DNA-binding transcriptional regulator YafY
MRRADRLFQLVQILRTRRFATADQLAEELQVSRRTVYRDIRDVERSGIPIRGEAGVGYRLDRGHELPPLTFNSEELAALVLGARMVAAWGDPDLAASSRSAMTKVEAVVPAALRRVLFETALFVPGRPWAPELTAGLGLLRRAIGERRKIRFDYTRADGEASARTVWPLGLWFWGASWSMAAWCELRGDYRNFRPDRMGDVELLDEHFDGDDGIGLQDFLKRVEEERGA